jgi:hypothetical protein
MPQLHHSIYLLYKDLKMLPNGVSFTTHPHTHPSKHCLQTHFRHPSTHSFGHSLLYTFFRLYSTDMADYYDSDEEFFSGGPNRRSSHAQPRCTSLRSSRDPRPSSSGGQVRFLDVVREFPAERGGTHGIRDTRPSSDRRSSRALYDADDHENWSKTDTLFGPSSGSRSGSNRYSSGGRFDRTLTTSQPRSDRYDRPSSSHSRTDPYYQSTSGHRRSSTTPYASSSTAQPSRFMSEDPYARYDTERDARRFSGPLGQSSSSGRRSRPTAANGYPGRGGYDEEAYFADGRRHGGSMSGRSRRPPGGYEFDSSDDERY